MEIRTYGLDRNLSKHYDRAIINRKSNNKFANAFTVLNYDRNFSSVNGICFTSFIEEGFTKLA